MTKMTMLLLLAALSTGLQAVFAVADELPKFDVGPTCRAETSGQNSAAAAACMADEQNAREQLSKEWEQFAAEIRGSCTQETTGIADVRSYVELLTCLQIARDATKLPNE
jgi:hypothetical protein